MAGLGRNTHKHLFNELNKEYLKFKNFLNANEKIHMSNPQLKDKEIITETFLTILKYNNVNCLYDVAYFSGFKTHFEHLKKIHKKSVQVAKNTGKYINNNYKSTSLHEELFFSLIGQIILYSFCELKKDESILRFNIYTDPIDISIKKQFIRNIEVIKNYKQNERYLVKSYDTENKKETIDFEYTIISSFKLPEFIDLNSIEYNIEIEDNALTFTADILAYALRKYFIEKTKNGPLFSLHSEETMNDFKYKELFNLSIRKDKKGSSTDFLYRHPSFKTSSDGNGI